MILRFHEYYIELKCSDILLHNFQSWEKAICKIKTGLHKSWIILRQILLQKKNISSCTHSPFYYSIKQLYFFLYVSSFYKSIQCKTIMLRYHAFCFLFWPILKYHFMKAIESLYCSKKKDNVLSNTFHQMILIFFIKRLE